MTSGAAVQRKLSSKISCTIHAEVDVPQATCPRRAGHGAMSSGAAAKLEETRTLVASLQTAVDFVKQLSESLAVVTQLLASATMIDVQEAITFLIYSHKFQVKSLQFMMMLGSTSRASLQNARQHSLCLRHVVTLCDITMAPCCRLLTIRCTATSVTYS